MNRTRPRLAAQAVALGAVAALLVVLVWRAVHHERPQVPVVLKPGKIVRAPNFELPRLDGNGRLSLASLRGKGVVLNFWATWCRPCKQEIPALQAAWKRNRARGLMVVGIDIQDFTGEARSFARRIGMTYPLVRDGRGKTIGPYAVSGVPETLFVSRSGRVVGRRIQGGVHLEKNRESFERGIALALRG